MPTILQFLHSYEDTSVTRIAGQIIQHLTPQGYTFHTGVAVDDPKQKAFIQSLGATTTEFFKTPPIPAAMRDFIRQNGVQIVHSHTPRTAVLTNLALRGVSNVAHVTTRHLLTQLNSRKMGLVYTAVDRVSLYMPNLIIPVSKTMGEQITSFPMIDPKKVFPIQNGVDTRRFYVPEERSACRAELGLRDNEIVFLFTGRLEWMKRIDLLLTAFHTVHTHHPHTRLLIAGVGTLETELKQQAESLGLLKDNAVVFLGFRRDVQRLLAACDVYVQSSSNEGLSLSILEAMAAEKAIIATNVGAALEVLENGVTAHVIPPLEVEPLTNAMLATVEQPEQAKALASRARAVVNAQFSVEKMAENYASAYQKFLSR
jgi:glycosyltransferase involved in cell wall biosynthesis